MVESGGKSLAPFTHVASYSGLLIPFGQILGPLVVWLIKKDEDPQVDHHGREAINFGISMLIYLIISSLLCLVIIGFIPLIFFFLQLLINPLIAAIKASNGSAYRYPLIIRFL